MEINSVLSDYLSREELAAELKVSWRTIARWEALGEAPPRTQFGRQIRYKRASVMAWLQAREREVA
jgi:excisionase family DNA binding protein